MWLINGHTVVNGSRYKLTYDGMYHLDVPKTRQYDTGKVEVIARSSVGEAIAETELKVIPRHDDYRGVLKNSPRRKFNISNNIYKQTNFTKCTYIKSILHITKNKRNRNAYNTANNFDTNNLHSSFFLSLCLKRKEMQLAELLCERE